MTRLIPSSLLAVVLTALITLGTAERVNYNETEVSGQFNENEFYRDLIECTTGLASIYATQDGRPLLWKNRDLGGGVDQEYHYIDDGRIPFISQAYAANGRRSEHYGGINAFGFAVENSNSYNFDDVRAGQDDDGFIMHLALATCRTVDDFQKIMDSTSIIGRTMNSNYGTFDAMGGAAMFEAASHSYTRIDAAEEPNGFIVRSNYSYSGRGLDARPGDWGPHRHDRGSELFKQGYINGGLTAKYLFQTVIRDLKNSGMDYYAVPYEGYWQGNPYGYLPNADVICRQTTRSVMIAQGVRPGQNPNDAILWAMAGNMMGSIALPLWVRAGSVPVEYDGVESGRLCDRSRVIYKWVYDDGGVLVNTFKLRNADGNGFWDWSVPLENWVFAKTEKFVGSPSFSYDQLAAFQNEMARAVADSIDNWRPALPVTEIVEPSFMDDRIVLHWGTSTNGGNGLLRADEQPRGYKVFRSDEPFREGVQGVLVAEVTDPRFVETASTDKSGFYRIEAVY